MSTFSSDIGPEEEDGGGWGGLVPTKAEREAERERDRLQTKAYAAGRADEREESARLLEALKAAERLLYRALMSKRDASEFSGHYTYIQGRDGSMLEASAVINACRAAIAAYTGTDSGGTGAREGAKT